MGRLTLPLILVAVMIPSVARAAEEEAAMQWESISAEVFTYYREQRYPEAVEMARRALEVAKATWPADHVNVATSLSILASLHYAQGHYAEAAVYYRQALAVYEQALGKDDPHVEAIAEHLADIRRAGGPDEPRGEPRGEPPEELPPAPPEPSEPSPRRSWRPRPLLLAPAWAETRSSLGLGHRVDNLKWSIAGDRQGQNPNILSELTWSDLQGIQVKGRHELYIKRHWYLRGTGDFGWIVNGDNQDSDYLGDNRTREFSRSENDGGGHVWDVSGGAGYAFRLLGDRVMLVPVAGYSMHRQELTISHGFQTVSNFGFGVPIGPIGNLHSDYTATWDGPWLGIDIEVEPRDRLRVFGGFEFHWADYRGVGNWNLRTDFRHPESFTQVAEDGSGVLVTAGASYRLTDQWSISAEFEYQDWSVGSGLDTTFLVNGTTPTTRFNEATWDAYAVSAEARYRF